MINGSIQEEDIIIANIYASNIEASQYIRQTWTDIKGEIDSDKIRVGDFNTQLTPMDRSSKQKINKETQVLKDTFEEMDLSDSFRTFHPNGKQKKAGEAILISDKIDLKEDCKRWGRTLHNDQGINPRGRHTIVNIYAPNIGAPQYIRQKPTMSVNKRRNWQ